MYLKRLELLGFKSFADKTALELDPGVIAIIGPNGCGKSNIGDAMRWVFGEQNPRLLRGNQMEDVIFNGTDARKAIGRAEVSVTFVNDDKTLPIDYHEVTITRRLFRSGESQYLLNQTPCLLRDIRELFMGTGIGTNAYFFLEQGRIDMVLSAKPEDRRAVFEEAAGIMKFKVKKKASLQRLESTESNLIRLADIIREVKRQIISLERQAGKARRYQEAREELKKLEVKVARLEFEDRSRELEQCLQELQKGTVSRDAIGSQVSALQKKIEEVEKNHQAIFDELHRLEKQDLDFYHRIETATGEVQLLKERISEFQTRILSDQQECDDAGKRLAQLKGLLVAEEASRNKFYETYKDQKAQLQQKKGSLEEVLQLFEKGEEDLNLVKDQLIDLKQQEAQFNNQLMVQHHRQKDLVLRREKLITEQEKLATHMKEKETERVQCESDQHGRNAGVLDLSKNLKSCFGEKEKLESEILRLSQELNKEKEKLLTHTARRQAAREFGALSHPSSSNLETLFHAVVDIPHTYKKALKAALGLKLGCVIKERRQLIEKRTQAVFLPMDVNIQSKAGDGLSNIAGFIGYASDLVRPSGIYGNASRALLRDLVVMKDFESLKGIQDQWLGHFRFVTLDGDFVDYDGTWSFNGVSEETVIDFASLDEEIRKATERMSQLQMLKTPLDQQLLKLMGDVASAQEVFRSKELELASVSGHLERLVAKEKDLQEENWTLLKEKEELDKEMEDLEKMIAHISESLSDLLEKIKVSSFQVEEKEKGVSDLEQQKELALVELAEVKVLSRSIEDEEKRFLGRILEIQTSVQELERLIAKRTEDVLANAKKKEEGQVRLLSLTDEIALRISERETLKTKSQEISAQVESITASIQADREVLNRQTEQFGKLRDEISSLEVKKAQAEIQKENVRQRVKEKYDLDLLNVALEIEGFSIEEVHQRIAELQEKLRQMGEVNLVAIQEFDEHRTRYDFLMKQQDDLVHSKEDLVRAIQKVNTTIREMFVDTFQKIQSTFNDLFRRLFGGGRAVLQLLDEGDVLECGIDISAQPPGKKLQSISLLSGGEKTMTALALLLAIFKVRPSPFCMMDEMDAALDESNILRFLSLLEDFKQQTQFILITHNKRTIGVADVIYGVTMEESGVSKLVSIRMAKDKTQTEDVVLAAS